MANKIIKENILGSLGTKRSLPKASVFSVRSVANSTNLLVLLNLLETNTTFFTPSIN
ncbi:MAG: hypothetical protein OEZ13_09370 [Spirochaetia bacterium]|nr:hypothetical protein [Spirochaetia bacterium]